MTPLLLGKASAEYDLESQKPDYYIEPINGIRPDPTSLVTTASQAKLFVRIKGEARNHASPLIVLG